MGEAFLEILDESTVTHGFRAILVTHIEPFPSWHHRNAPHALESVFLVVLHLLGVLGANRLPFLLPSLLELDAGTNLADESAVNLTIGSARQLCNDFHKKGLCGLYHTSLGGNLTV